MPNSIKTQLQGEIHSEEIVNEQMNCRRQSIKATIKRNTEQGKCTDRLLKNKKCRHCECH